VLKEVDPAARKAAIVLLAMDKKDASEVMRSLSPACLDKVTAAISSMDEVDSEEQKNALMELGEKIRQNPLIGGSEQAYGLLTDAFGEDKAREFLERSQQRATSKKAFLSLMSIKSSDLANFMANEQSATIAIVLGFLPSTKVAEILRFLDERKRAEIILRMASPMPAKPDIIRRIEDVFVKNIVSKVAGEQAGEEQTIGGAKQVAEIILNLDKEVGDQMLGVLQDNSPELAAEISSELFTFADIVKLSDSDIQRIMRDVPMEKLPMALRGVDEELFGKFANNLSKRARENMLEEMELMGKVKLSEVQAVQKEIVTLVRSLEAAGEISISMGGEEDQYV